jgi:hypothetical protein
MRRPTSRAASAGSRPARAQLELRLELGLTHDGHHRLFETAHGASAGALGALAATDDGLSGWNLADRLSGSLLCPTNAPGHVLLFFSREPLAAARTL